MDVPSRVWLHPIVATLEVLRTAMDRSNDTPGPARLLRRRAAQALLILIVGIAAMVGLAALWTTPSGACHPWDTACRSR